MITPPKPLVNVNPGDPVKSEDWNNVLDAVRNVYSHLNTPLGAVSVVVTDKADGNPVIGAQVSLLPGEAKKGRPRAALYVGAGVNRYLAYELIPGKYKLVCEAPGFDDESRDITVGEDGTVLNVKVVMTAIKPTVVMVNVFGLPLNEAMKKVEEGGLQVNRIIDSHGNEIPPGNVPEEQNTAVILGQVPEPGVNVPLNSQVQLHTAAKAEFVERVKVPDLSGLTLEEAKAKLEASQLVLGTTTNVGT